MVEKGLKWVTVQKPVPYPGFFGTPTPSEQQRLNSDRTLKGFERWTATRYTNPFIEAQTATGFEGYFIGLGFSPEEVADQIAQLGCNVLESFRRLHPNNGSYMSTVWKVAKGEVYNQEILAELNAVLGATTARLRVNVLPQKNPHGSDYRNRIASLMEGQRIEYKVEDEVVTSHTMKVLTGDQTSAIPVDERTFSGDALRRGYAFMQLLGRAGYPLVRLTVRR